jgi:DNA-binding CsgD family transcriptional regulator/tetratricopeptide (TPR) repeat protein
LTRIKLMIVMVVTILSGSNLISQKEILEDNWKIVDSLYSKDPLEALNLSEQNIDPAIQFGDTILITNFLDVAGELNTRFGNYDNAISQLNDCLSYKLNWKSLKDLSLTHNNLGKVYIEKGLYELAAFHLLEALKLMETSDNILGQGFYLNNLGALYDLQHNYIKAISYYEKSLSLKKKISDSNGIAASSTNLGISYFNIGDYDAAIAYYNEAVIIYSKGKNYSKIGRTISNRGVTYLAANDIEKARKDIKAALLLIDSIDNMANIAHILDKNANFHLTISELDSALFYNNRALELARNIGSKEKLKNNYKFRSEILDQMSELDSALFYLRLSIAYDDSLVNKQNIYAVAEMEGKYNYEKSQRVIKEQELQNLNNQKTLSKQRINFLYLSIVMGVVLGGILLLYIFYINKKRKNELLAGQNALVKKRNNELDELNQRITSEVHNLKTTIEEKESLLKNVFDTAIAVDLPEDILSLSNREMEVFRHLSLGYSDDQLAEKLFISKSTIKTHLRSIYSKLDVRGRAEAIVIAHKYNLVGAD